MRRSQAARSQASLWHKEQQQIKLYAALLMASPEDQHGSLAAFHHSNAQGFLCRKDQQQTRIMNKM